MLIVAQTVTAEQMATAMRHFSDAAVKLFGKALMDALTHQWDHNKLRMFLAAQEDALLAAERECDAERVNGSATASAPKANDAEKS